MKKNNCAHCENIEVIGGTGFASPGCKLTGFVLPHSYDGNEFIFWRVPMSCPLSDDVVNKQEKRPAQKTWTTIPAKELI